MATSIIGLHANYRGYAARSDTALFTDTAQEAWDALHDGVGTSNSDSSMKAGWSEGVAYDKVLYRGFFGYDTSRIGASAIILEATIQLSGTEYRRNVTGDYYIGSSDQGSGIENNDFEGNITTTNYATVPAQGTGSGEGSRNFNLPIVLNYAGRAYLNKTGITTFSWRCKIDQTDSGYTVADSHNHMIISSGTMTVIYANASKIFTETFSIIDPSITKAHSFGRIFTETIAIIEPFLAKLNGVTLKSFVESISVAATATTKSVLHRVYTEAISLTNIVLKFVNGITQDRWTRGGKPTSIWTKQEKNSSTWTKTPR